MASVCAGPHLEAHEQDLHVVEAHAVAEGYQAPGVLARIALQALHHGLLQPIGLHYLRNRHLLSNRKQAQPDALHKTSDHQISVPGLHLIMLKPSINFKPGQARLWDVYGSECMRLHLCSHLEKQP